MTKGELRGGEAQRAGSAGPGWLQREFRAHIPRHCSFVPRPSTSPPSTSYPLSALGRRWRHSGRRQTPVRLRSLLQWLQRTEALERPGLSCSHLNESGALGAFGFLICIMEIYRHMQT